MSAQLLKEAVAEMEGIRKNNATMEKDFRMNNPVEAAEDDARVAARDSPIDGLGLGLGLVGHLAIVSPVSLRTF